MVIPHHTVLCFALLYIIKTLTRCTPRVSKHCTATTTVAVAASSCHHQSILVPFAPTVRTPFLPANANKENKRRSIRRRHSRRRRRHARKPSKETKLSKRRSSLLLCLSLLRREEVARCHCTTRKGTKRHETALYGTESGNPNEEKQQWKRAITRGRTTAEQSIAESIKFTRVHTHSEEEEEKEKRDDIIIYTHADDRYRQAGRLQLQRDYKNKRGSERKGGNLIDCFITNCGIATTAVRRNY